MSDDLERFVAKGIQAQRAVVDELVDVDDLPITSIDQIINPEADDPTPRRWARLQWGGALDADATEPTHVSSPQGVINSAMPLRFVRPVACETGRKPVYGPWQRLDDLPLAGKREPVAEEPATRMKPPTAARKAAHAPRRTGEPGAPAS